jgi:AcrR family transcriptional regulator
MTSPPTAPRAATARQRARAELTREIKEEARRQLAVAGVGGLSLRAVASELGMVSSALYRYFPSRDDLLTALIVDAYNALGDAAEQAIAGPATARERWIAAWHAVRGWARSNPHEYALIYGSPVPGYRAPEATIGPAARVPLAFVGVIRSALAAGEFTAVNEALSVTGALADQAEELSAALARSATAAEPPGIAPDALVRAVIAWAQLFGMISFELFGQFVGSFEPADALFAYAAAQSAAFVGIR